MLINFSISAQHEDGLQLQQMRALSRLRYATMKHFYVVNCEHTKQYIIFGEINRGHMWAVTDEAEERYASHSEIGGEQ